MENYDPNIRWDLHTVEVSFQRGVCKGLVTFVRSGNCKGLDVLDIDEEDLYNMKFRENLIDFRPSGEDDNGDGWLAMTLKGDERDGLLVEDAWEELSGYIVRTEIIDSEEEK